MGGMLTQASTLMCPHGGTITAIPSDPSVKADGSTIAQSTDSFVIAGCAFNIAGAPQPCIRVQWITTANQVKGRSAFALTLESVGLCIGASGAPQGPVQITNTQQKASAR